MRKLSRRKLVGGALCGGMLAATGTVGPRVWAGQKVQTELEEAAAGLDAARNQARELGIPLGSEDVAVKVTATQNAAPLYQELQRYLDGMSVAEQMRRSVGLLQRQSDAERRLARTLLEEWRPQLRLAEEIAARPECDFELKWEDVPDFPFPPYTAMRVAAYLLAAKARNASEDGRVDEAGRALAASGQILQHIQTISMILSMAVLQSASSMLDGAFRQLLRRHASASNALPYLVEAHRAISVPGDLRHALRGEVLFYLASVRAPHRTIREQSSRIEDLDTRTDAQKETDQRLLQFPEQLVSAAFQTRGLEFFMRLFTALDAAGAEPYAIRTAWTQTAAAEKARQAASFRQSAEFATDLDGGEAYPAHVRVWAQLREAALDLLVERHHTGAFPEALPRSVSDPYDGQPLRYRRSGEGFVVYSVGMNLKDDGGKPGPATGGSPDVVLTYP